MTLPSVDSERLIFVASFKRWPVAPVLPCLSEPWTQTANVRSGQCHSTRAASFPQKYLIFPDTYSKINQVKLSHAHNLVSIHTLLTAFNGDGEDCVRTRAVFIHVGGTNRTWLKQNDLKYNRQKGYKVKSLVRLLTVFVAQSHKPVHVIGVVYNITGEVFDINTNIWSFFHLWWWSRTWSQIIFADVQH